MPAVRTILGMRTISETSALVFGHLPVILSMRVYLHIQPTFPYPVWNPTGPLRPGSVSRVFFLKNLKGRVSERTLRNTERYALSRYLPHSHFFPNPSDFREKKFAAVVSQTDWHAEYDSNSQCGENDPVHQCAWERWMSWERFLIPNPNAMRTIPETNAMRTMPEPHEVRNISKGMPVKPSFFCFASISGPRVGSFWSMRMSEKNGRANGAQAFACRIL